MKVGSCMVGRVPLGSEVVWLYLRSSIVE
jgi:hypothetical protein